MHFESFADKHQHKQRSSNGNDNDTQSNEALGMFIGVEKGEIEKADAEEEDGCDDVEAFHTYISFCLRIYRGSSAVSLTEKSSKRQGTKLFSCLNESLAPFRDFVI